MPKTKKGKKVFAALKKEYGAKKGESVYYALVNSGKLKGAEPAKKKKTKKGKKK